LLLIILNWALILFEARSEDGVDENVPPRWELVACDHLFEFGRFDGWWKVGVWAGEESDEEFELRSEDIKGFW
jgi:hypothetical protein